MIDEEQTRKYAQENMMDYDFVKLYLEEIESIFRTKFCFSDKSIQKYIDRIFKKTDEEMLDYLYSVFAKFAAYGDESLTGMQRLARETFATTVVKKTIELYDDNKKKIRDEFFLAIEEAKSIGIDIFRMSNKTTFQKLTLKNFRKSLNALVEDEYLDKNTNKKFKIFEQVQDAKQMFEECSSLAFKFQQKSIQSVLDLLSDFTYDKEKNCFYGDVDYLKMIKKCKGILTTSVERLQNTMAFLDLYFLSGKDEAEKIDIFKKIELNPSILVIAPDKIEQLASALQAQGVSEERVNNFCFNIDHLAEANGVSKENIQNLARTKQVLKQYLNDESVLDALTNANFITKRPVVLDVIFKRAISEGLFDKLLKRPTVLADFGGEETGVQRRQGVPKKRGGSDKFNSRDGRGELTAEEKDMLKKQTLILSDEEKEYIDGIMEKLKTKEKDDSPEHDDKPNTTEGPAKTDTPPEPPVPPAKKRILDDALLDEIHEIREDLTLQNREKIVLISEMCMNKIYGRDYAKKKFASDMIMSSLHKFYKIWDDECFVVDLGGLRLAHEISSHIDDVASRVPSMLDDEGLRSFATEVFFTDEFAGQLNDMEDVTKTMREIASAVDAIQRKTLIIEQRQAATLKVPLKNKAYKCPSVFLADARLNRCILTMTEVLREKLGDEYEFAFDEKLMTGLERGILDHTFIEILKIAADGATEITGAEEQLYVDKPMDALAKTFNTNIKSWISHDELYFYTPEQTRCFLKRAYREVYKGKTGFSFAAPEGIDAIMHVEHDEEGIYLKMKKGYTLFYPETKAEDWAKTLRMAQVSEETKSLPRVTMTQDRIFDDLEKL